MRTVGAYEVGERLPGNGADLYEGRRDGRSFLLAFYDLRKADAEHIEAEVRRTSALAHEAIVPVVEVIPSAGSWVAVFERSDGLTLQQMVVEAAGERLPDSAALFVAHRLFTALDAAHTATVDGKIAPLVHARLGPQQIYVGWDGDVRMLGFGLSRLYRLSTAVDSDAAASPYAAPEVRSGGALTVRANIYAAALMAWSLLTGESPPAEGEPTPLSQLRPDLPDAIVRALDQALAKSLLERRVTANQLASAIEPHVADGRAELGWFLEPLKAIANFDDVLMIRASLPPEKALSSIPAESLPPLILFAPETVEFLDAVTLVPPSDDDAEGTRVTIPAPPRTS